MKPQLAAMSARVTSAPKKLWLAALGGLVALVVVMVVLALDDDVEKKKRSSPASERAKAMPTLPDAAPGTAVGVTSTTPTTSTIPTGRVTTPEPAEPATVRKTQRCASTGDPTTGALPGDDAIGKKKWVTVVSLSGNCDASSGGFKLGDFDTRIVLRSDAESIAAFITAPDGSTEDSAGFADFECTGPCSDTSAVVGLTGSFGFRVQAGNAPWQALVQQYR